MSRQNDDVIPSFWAEEQAEKRHTEDGATGTHNSIQDTLCVSSGDMHAQSLDCKRRVVLLLWMWGWPWISRSRSVKPSALGLHSVVFVHVTLPSFFCPVPGIIYFPECM